MTTAHMAAKQRKPKAFFMAFGTKGDVLPLAALASSLAEKQPHYDVAFATHVAHEYLKSHLAKANVTFLPISTPSVLPLEVHDEDTETDLHRISPFLKRRALEYQHRKECLSAVEKHFEEGSELESDFILINFFALEGWHLAEAFQVRCIIASPYVIPYSAPSIFEHKFQTINPLLYKRLQNAPCNKVCWRDVMHWMWPLFMDRWVSWRTECLKLSPYFLTDPVTSLPVVHNWPESPLVLYGFSREIVEFPDYWPPNVHACGCWLPPLAWELCSEKCSHNLDNDFSSHLITDHIPASICSFLMEDSLERVRPIFIGLSSIGSMGYIDNPDGVVLLLKAILQATNYKIFFLTSDYQPLNFCIQAFAQDIVGNGNYNEEGSSFMKDGVLLFDKRLLCYPGSIPYSWLFPKCSIVIHHGGSGTTAAALTAGVPQCSSVAYVLNNIENVKTPCEAHLRWADLSQQSGLFILLIICNHFQIICPFILDQFYWAERMSWIGVAPPPLTKKHLIPDSTPESISEAATVVSRSLHAALREEMRSRATSIAEKLRAEDGIGNAVNILVNQVCASC